MSNHTLSPEQRLQRLEDVESIKALKYQYARHLDDGYQADPIASLFVEDGEWIIKGVGGEVRGHSAIKAHCANLRASIGWSQHNIFAPEVEINEAGDQATARFNLLCLLTMLAAENTAESEAYVLSGQYEDHLIKREGQWLFKAMTGTIEQSSPWTQGWVKAPFQKESW